jgi:hypothetical protein
MGAIKMVLRFHPLADFVIIAGIHHAVLNPYFAKHFCIMAVVMDLHAAE